MSWFHVDDKFHGHPKAAEADEAGIGAWTKLGSWSSLHQTDGRIPGSAARKLCTRKGLAAAVKARLLLHDPAADTYTISGYLDCNPSAAVVAARRDKWAEKKRTARDVPRGVPAGHADVSPGDSTSSEPEDSSHVRARSPVPSPSPSPSQERAAIGGGQGPPPPLDDWPFDGPPPSDQGVTPTQRASAGAADRIFLAYVEGWTRTVGGTRPPRLDDKRRKLINTRLRSFSPEELEAAVRGIWLSQWNVENRRTDFELALRDSAHVERFRDIAARPELGKDSNGPPQARDAEARSSLQKPAQEGVRKWPEGPHLFPQRNP